MVEAVPRIFEEFFDADKHASLAPMRRDRARR